VNEATRTRVIIVGCAGRMGQTIAQLIKESRDLALSAGVDVARGADTCMPSDVATELVAVIDAGDVVVDFSAPEPAAANARLAMVSGKPFVTGVTGFLAPELAVLRECGRTIPVVHAPNFSVGVSVLTRLAAEAARLLGPDYDIEITETHHRMKKDAPSGTARQLLDTLRAATGRTEVVCGREGMVGPKPAGQIGVSSIRSGTWSASTRSSLAGRASGSNSPQGRKPHGPCLGRACRHPFCPHCESRLLRHGRRAQSVASRTLNRPEYCPARSESHRQPAECHPSQLAAGISR